MDMHPQCVLRRSFSQLSAPIKILVFIGSLFFVSLYIPGFSLASTLQQPGCLSVSEGNSINDTIDPVGDEDCFVFQGVTQDLITIFVDNNTSTGSHRMNATVFNPDGSIWGTATDNSPFGNGDLQIGRQILTATGTYTIIVNGSGNTTGNYTLGYSNLRNDITTITEGQSVASNLGFVGDEDAYAFQGQVGDLATVFVDNNTSTGSHRMNVTVFNPDGSVWGTATDTSPFGNGDLEVNGQVFTTTGTYKIFVDGAGDTTGSYTLGYSNLRNDTSPIIEGQGVTSTVGFVGDEDAYTFQGQAGNLTTVFIDNNTSTGSHRMHLTVLKPDGSVWGSDVDESPFGNGDLQLGRQALPATGTYTLIVDGAGDTTGNYILGYSNLSNDITSIIEGHAEVDTIGFVGDEDAYTFQGQAGDLVTFFVDNNTSTGGHRMQTTVLTPDGSVLGSDTDDSPFGNGDLQIGRQALPAAGAYTVLVDGVGDTTGSYTLGYSNLQEDPSSVTYGQTLDRTIGFPGDEDVFTFHGNAGTEITVFVDNNTSTGSHRMQLTVFNPDGSVWGTDSDDSPFGNGDLQLGQQALPATGTYTIVVDGYGDATGLYAFSLECNKQCPEIMFWPTVGGNSGDVTLTIVGQSLNVDAQVKLSKIGGIEIIPTKIIKSPAKRQLLVTFDLSNKTPDTWDVVLTNPDGSSITLHSTFQIVNGGGGELALDLLGPATVRVGREAKFTAIVRNESLVDFRPVLVEITAEQVTGDRTQSSQLIEPITHFLSGISILPPGASKIIPFPVIFPSPSCGSITGDAETFAASGSLDDCIAGCEAKAEACFITCEDITDPNQRAVCEFNCSAEAGKCMSDCLKTHPPKDRQPTSSNLPICPVTSWDPNDKVNVPGVSEIRYVRATTTLPYIVFFENLANATAAAEEILITDQLDPNLDWSTFALNDLRIGEKIITVPPGAQNFTTTIDLRSAIPALVVVDVKFNSTTGRAEWLFRGKNLDTGELTGFLPPNTTDVAPLGEGSVSYSVKPKQNLPTSTIIRNKATIDFEVNIPPAPMDTPEVFNTIDADAPTSKVLKLVPTQKSNSFEVQCSGTDIGSGIGAYTIYVADNNGPYQPWLTNVVSTTAIFTGLPGHTYHFFSRARDKVGNYENLRMSPDLTILISSKVYLPVVAR